jgi:hypothetical protein
MLLYSTVQSLQNPLAIKSKGILVFSIAWSFHYACSQYTLVWSKSKPWVALFDRCRLRYNRNLLCLLEITTFISLEIAASLNAEKLWSRLISISGFFCCCYFWYFWYLVLSDPRPSTQLHDMWHVTSHANVSITLTWTKRRRRCSIEGWYLPRHWTE